MTNVVTLLVRTTAVVLSAGLAGCAGPSVRDSTPDSTPSGLQFVVQRRGSEDAIKLELWVDAGSRDATPAQVATVAAWEAAMAAPAVSARCLPDATVFEMVCTRHGFRPCLEQLATVLRARTPRHIESLRARLGPRRRQMRATAFHDARELALQTLFGDDLTALQPLGTPAGDPEVTADRVSTYLTDHLGADRALLVVEGNVDSSEISSDVRRVFSDTRRAREPRADRALSGRTGIAMTDGEPRSFAIAVATPTLRGAQAVADVLTDRVSSGLNAHVTALRGSALTVIAGRRPDDLSSVLRLARRAWSYPLSDEEELVPPQGQRWAFANGDAATEPQSEISVAVGLIGDWNGNREPNTLAPPTRTLEWERSSGEMTARTVRGAQLVRLEGNQRLVGLRVRTGSAAEPPDRHGLTAVTAHIAADACDAHPFVNGASWGLVVRPRRGRETADAARLVDCVQSSVVTNGRLERGRAAALEDLTAYQLAEARSSALLFPNAPGVVAPWGNPRTLRQLSLRDVQPRFPPRAGDVELLWIGPPVPDEEAGLVALATRLDELPSGAGPTSHSSAPTGPTPPIQSFESHASDGANTRVLVAWRGTPGGLGASARIAAEEYGRRIARQPYPAGTEPEHVIHGASPEGAPFVAISYRVREHVLDGFPRVVTEARAAERRTEPDLARARTAATLRAATEWARVTDGPARPSDDSDVERIYRILREATPRFGVTRPGD